MRPEAYEGPAQAPQEVGQVVLMVRGSRQVVQRVPAARRGCPVPGAQALAFHALREPEPAEKRLAGSASAAAPKRGPAAQAVRQEMRMNVPAVKVLAYRKPTGPAKAMVCQQPMVLAGFPSIEVIAE